MTIKTSLLFTVCLAFSVPALSAPWHYFGGDAGAQRFSAATEITPDNVKNLKKAWETRTGEMAEFGETYNLVSVQNTPALIEDSLIACSAFNRIIAMDPGTGEEQWRFDPWAREPMPESFIYRCRGLAYWQDQSPPEDPARGCRQRLFMALPNNQVVAVDAQDGTLCEDFGNNGRIAIERSGEMLFPGEMALNNPGTVIGDVVVFGGMIVDSFRAASPSGKVVALDVHTGAVRWEYDPIPRSPEDPAYSTWQDDSAIKTGGANTWPAMTADESRDLLFLPTGSPSPDFYGGQRRGENRDANSLVALRGSTGEKVWSYQLVHHDLWDYDLPAPPVLVDIEREGVTIPAVVQTTKMGLVFMFNRETGEPIFDIEERSVPQTHVPGEWTSPTQPFPVKPAPLLDYAASPKEAWGFTFWDKGRCRKLFTEYENRGIYTPPTTKGTIQKPAWIGGMNWGGPAVDPNRSVLVVNLSNISTTVKLEPRTPDMKPMQILTVDDTAIWRRHAGGDMIDTPYRVKLDFTRSPFGAPCNAPPWGKLAAIDLKQGEILWQRPLGTIDRLAPIPIPLELGTPNIGGPAVTSTGLVFIAATMDDRIRAFDLATGEELWKARLPAGGQAGVMTYEWQNRQYVVIAAGGHAWMDTKRGDYFVAYALPEKQ